ncbi:hypothetical protein [Streptomyces sp. PsTaAH-130]|uniref:hypothetical protein n=1 Tax=Streptomyces sp. SID8366 TaxID=2690348 RepID=UPI000DB93EB7|nr:MULTISPECIES: hypothetical protein [unclassified Streptomyces]
MCAPALHLGRDGQVVVHADHGEMRPEADEAVRSGAGRAWIVPRGHWHRARPDAPSDLMSLTLRRGARRAPIEGQGEYAQ